MKTILAILFCLAVMAAAVGIICCMASSMVSRAEEKYERRTDA